MEFLAPLGWLVACAAVLPVAAAIVRDRRERGVLRTLGLGHPPAATRFAGAAAAAVVVLLLAAATARPAVRTSGAAHVRTDAQVFFVVDISRSMLARNGSNGQTRYTRALAAAERIRGKLGDIPAGVASLTDRLLPHLFPSPDSDAFAAVLHRVLGIERPPPGGGLGRPNATQTNYLALSELAGGGYYGSRARHRVAILLSDGESDQYMPESINTQLAPAHVHLLIVRFWGAGERVYSGGRPERYRPDPSSLGPLQQLARFSGHSRVFSERDTSAVVRAARSLLGHGATETLGRPKRLELAPYAALAALLPLAFVLRRRDR